VCKSKRGTWFAGFTTQTWNPTLGQFAKDPEAFIANLSTGVKLDADGYTQIIRRPGYGPCFKYAFQVLF
jgi:hypothetical protein